MPNFRVTIAPVSAGDRRPFRDNPNIRAVRHHAATIGEAVTALNDTTVAHNERIIDITENVDADYLDEISDKRILTMFANHDENLVDNFSPTDTDDLFDAIETIARAMAEDMFFPTIDIEVDNSNGDPLITADIVTCSAVGEPTLYRGAVLHPDDLKATLDATGSNTNPWVTATRWLLNQIAEIA